MKIDFCMKGVTNRKLANFDLYTPRKVHPDIDNAFTQ